MAARSGGDNRLGGLEVAMAVDMRGGYLTAREAAALARLSTRRLAELRMSGTGPRCVRTSAGPTGKALYRESDVHTWLRRNAEQFDRRMGRRRSGS